MSTAKHSSHLPIGHPSLCRDQPLKLLLWGTESQLTQVVFNRLAAQWPLAALVVPAMLPNAPAVAALLPPAPAADELTLVNQFVHNSTVALAWQLGLSVYALGRLHSPAVRDWLHRLQPDLVCVACFPWRIPARLLAIPTAGFLNLHPARLPHYRGPAPLFWQLRDGVQESAVTIHWMDETFDTGAIAAQAPLLLAEGSSGPQVDQHIGDLGASLFTEVLTAIRSGTMPRQPQPAGGSYQSWPAAADFRLDAHWSAQHAFNFMRGTAEWQQPYQFVTGERTIYLTRALDYRPKERLAKPFIQAHGVVAIQCQPGVLRAQVL